MEIIFLVQAIINSYMGTELYCCYSLSLRNFLYENGLRYKLAVLNPNSKKLFWVYLKNEKLNMLLNEWSAKNRSLFYIKLRR